MCSIGYCEQISGCNRSRLDRAMFQGYSTYIYTLGRVSCRPILTLEHLMSLGNDPHFGDFIVVIQRLRVYVHCNELLYYVHVCTCMYVHVCTCMYVHVCMCMYVHVCVTESTNVYVIYFIWYIVYKYNYLLISHTEPHRKDILSYYIQIYFVKHDSPSALYS